MEGYFITATDTHAGKTVVSAWLISHLGGNYWKPIQSGLEDPPDADIVQYLSGFSDDHFFPSTYTFQAPMSPHESARREGVKIDLDRFNVPESSRPLIIEGAGGLLVPLNEDALMIDLIKRFAYPVILVARTGLGTINHTLLSLEALQKREIALAGVILSGQPYPSNRDAIKKYGRVKILAEIPQITPLTPETLTATSVSEQLSY
ncbi:dethiobiotin synthase [Magnetococcales bacterium HHB-1]